MSIRRRIRSTIKWGGAVLTVLLLIVWVGSRWYLLILNYTPAISIGAAAGQLHIGWDEPWFLTIRDVNHPRSLFLQRSFPFEWWFGSTNYLHPRGMTVRRVIIPIWFLALLTATPTFLIWRRDCKPLPGACPKCGYSRTGLPRDRACPECGAPA